MDETRNKTKYRVLDALGRLRLDWIAYQVYAIAEPLNPLTLWHNARLHASKAAGDLPIPPARLVNLTAGTSDLRWFLESGRQATENIVEVLAKNGTDINGLSRILDFGCGCGRVIRHIRAFTTASLCGTDYNLELVQWCRLNLPRIGEFSSNGLLPPTTYDAARFDFIYLLSVFTHMSGVAQAAWMAEFSRILRPGGLLLISTHGERYVDRLNAREAERFQRGELIVKRSAREGSNLCTAFHPERYVRLHLSRGFNLIEFIPGGAKGTPHQDLYLLARGLEA